MEAGIISSAAGGFDLGTVAVVVAFVLSVFNLWDKIDARIKQAKAPMSGLESRVKILEELIGKRFSEYDDHFSKDLRRIESIEEGNKVMQKAMLALLKHAIDGNNVEDLRRASKDLQDYLIDK